MEKSLILLKEAQQCIKTADHLCYVTFPTVNDNKILMAIAENIYIGMVSAMEALLQYEKEFRRLYNIPENFDLRFDLFKSNLAKKYNIDRTYIYTMDELRKLLQLHKKSQMEFNRKGSYVILADDFKLKTLNINKIKQYVNNAKPFINDIDTIISRSYKFR
ncbi:hypothetical protein J4455_04775 [Candidatus Woesearchaeota archaeon]|nr:hypothetical protein [Candidatus Woesearchaeota archaeon]